VVIPVDPEQVEGKTINTGPACLLDLSRSVSIRSAVTRMSCGHRASAGRPSHTMSTRSTRGRQRVGGREAVVRAMLLERVAQLVVGISSW